MDEKGDVEITSEDNVAVVGFKSVSVSEIGRAHV